MKKVIFSLLAICVLYSCSNSAAPEQEAVTDTTEIASNDAVEVIDEAVEPSDSTIVEEAESENL